MITALGAMLIATGAAVVMIGLLEVPVFVPHVGWALEHAVSVRGIMRA